MYVVVGFLVSVVVDLVVCFDVGFAVDLVVGLVISLTADLVVYFVVGLTVDLVLDWAVFLALDLVVYFVVDLVLDWAVFLAVDLVVYLVVGFSVDVQDPSQILLQVFSYMYMSCTFGRTCILGLAGLVVGLDVVFDIFMIFCTLRRAMALQL